MTEDEPTPLTDSKVCEYLSAHLKRAYSNGDLPEVFKDQTIEFQSTPNSDGWTIYWVFKGRQLDSVKVDSLTSSKFTDVMWEFWAHEVVTGWIDAYLYPSIDNVDLEDAEWEWVSDGKTKADHSALNGVGGTVIIDFAGVEARVGSFAQRLQELHEVLKKNGVTEARVPLKVPSMYDPGSLGLRNDMTHDSPNLNRLRPERIPLEEVGTMELDRTISRILKVKTRLKYRNQMVIVNFDPESRIGSYSFDYKMWQQFECGHILRRLKDHVYNCQERLRGSNES